ncbi:terminase small subunit [Ruminococcus sp.]|uniref:terminase small subunit n=1 Tax=Ruminococcus sp. TaxID=41978 RepID=UPI0025E7CA5A|nr:terminase small subunit [Ruminococcus sp.]MBQ8965945.1 terminase small subunit [Ruminococcus sp.]
MKISARAFAKMFVRTRNGSETAVRLGAEPAEAKRIEADFLANAAVKREIKKLDKEDMQTLCYVKTGLSRLAFGSINEAAALVFAEELKAEDVLKADLFNVAEIKRVKGGGVEMKFFDRQKALEKLVELDPELKEVSAAQEFLNAVYGGSQDLRDVTERGGADGEA